jgi:muramoyltetrapeptide carboxypeptidase
VRAEEAVRPPALQPGDLVAVVSPSGPVRPELVAAGVALLRSWGLRPVPAPHAFDQHAYLAGTDSDRLADLNAALADPEVRGIVVTRGGYGVQRIVDRIDLAAVRRDPKPVVGFSDLTALQLALWRGARMACLHGPGAAWRVERTGPASAQSLRNALMSLEPVVVEQDPVATTAPVTRPGPVPPPGPAGRPGTAAGRLLGGNLSVLAATLGSPDFPDLTGAILLVEEVGEPPYKVDRMLTQLRRAGVLSRLAGVAVGQFLRCTDRWSTDVADVLDERLRELAVPVLGGLPVGHGPDQLTVPVGVPALLDVPAATLTVSPAVC